mgnify:CR=1 FL=1
MFIELGSVIKIFLNLIFFGVYLFLLLDLRLGFVFEIFFKFVDCLVIHFNDLCWNLFAIDIGEDNINDF